MTVITENRILGVVRTAESVLSQRAGSPVTLADPEDLGGSGRTTVVRVRVAQNPLSMDRSLVIKALPQDEEPHAFHREIASYKYATALPSESRPGPQIIASDPVARVLVLSDLGHGRTMTSLLSGTDITEISHAVSAWGQALGRMHAATFDGEHDFAALLRRGTDGCPGNDILLAQARSAVERYAAISSRLAVDADRHVSELLAASLTLFTEGEHRAFSTSDVGPENIVINDDGVQFMDYEWGGFRDATLDIAYALVTCGARISALDRTQRERAEVALVDAWRSEVSAIWPALVHDRESASKILTARVLWVWLSTVWMLPGDELLGADADADAAALAEGSAAAGHLHDLALYVNDPRVIVTRWADLAAAAERAGDTALARTAGTLGRALSRDWLG